MALVLGVLALATVFVASTSIARADEAELVVADAATVIQLAEGDDPAPGLRRTGGLHHRSGL